MSKELPYGQAAKIFDKVLTIDLEAVPVISEKYLYRDELAAEVRSLLKLYGISSRQISVTKPTGSMVYWVDITLPYIDNGLTWSDFNKLTQDEKEAYFEGNKPKEEHRQQAWNHMRNVMNTAFPANQCKSDPMTDYFDFSWTVQ